MDIKLDTETHDLAFEKSDLVLALDEHDLLQRCKTRLYTILGEVDELPTTGVDWFGVMFGVTEYDDKIREINNALLTVDGITEVVAIAMQIDPNLKTGHIDFSCATVYNNTITGGIDI